MYVNQFHLIFLAILSSSNFFNLTTIKLYLKFGVFFIYLFFKKELNTNNNNNYTAINCSMLIVVGIQFF